MQKSLTKLNVDQRVFYSGNLSACFRESVFVYKPLARFLLNERLVAKTFRSTEHQSTSDTTSLRVLFTSGVCRATKIKSYFVVLQFICSCIHK